MQSGCIAPGCTSSRGPGSVFCDSHVRAPSGQRGGWLSAYRRRQKMGSSATEPLDASNVTKRLWIGGAPPFERDLPEFDVLVLCAAELQPQRLAFARRVLRCPLPDAHLERAELNRAIVTARGVAQSLAGGHRVLVTCAQGRNRSAFVTGLAMGMLFEASAQQIIHTIRSRRRADCLTNPHFVALLERVVGQMQRARGVS